jgi:hypothetical protein
MKKRSVVGVVIFPLLTFGIYGLYWLVSTKGELNQKGAQIPTAWLLIVPIANLFWLWKYYEGAQQVTNEKVNAVLMFVLGLFITPLIPYALCQDAYNNLGEAAPVASATPEVPSTPPQAPVA